MGFVFATAGSYLDDQTMLTRAWDGFRTYAGDPTAPDRENINIRNAISNGWANAPSKPEAKAVTPLGMSFGSFNLSGAIGNDMSRAGPVSSTPAQTEYPWVGVEGFIPATLILHRAGYPAFEVGDQAVKRTHDFLWSLSKANPWWWDAGDPGRAAEAKYIVNTYYGLSYTVPLGVGPGRTVGYTDWTHPTKASLSATITVPPPPTADTAIPSVGITSPVNGTSLTGSVSISIDASDNIGVTRVDLYRNDQPVGTDTSAPYGFVWDTINSTNGTYTMYAKAFDAAGNSATSNIISVNLSNTTITVDATAPVVSISTPASGVTVSGRVNIQASATDNVRVTSIKLFIDGTLMASDSTGSIFYSWNVKPKNIARGNHVITIRATDAAGNFGEKSITVTK